MRKARQRRNGRGSAWKAAETFGCDMSQIESNLCKTTSELMLAHSRALATALELRAAMEKRHART